MRMRNKPWAQQYLEANPQIVILDGKQHQGRWQQLFDNKQPIHIEIGTGKGRFITEMAKANPHINYIGLELQKNVIVSVLEKALTDNITNLKLINDNASSLTEMFAENEIDRLYLNFSDPWPKTKHAKRRLTHPNFLTLYKTILSPLGEIHFKTDNQGLFEYSLHSLSTYGMALKNISLDLHNANMEDNIMTEYEQKFSAKGFRINRLEATF